MATTYISLQVAKSQNSGLGILNKNKYNNNIINRDVWCYKKFELKAHPFWRNFKTLCVLVHFELLLKS